MIFRHFLMFILSAFLLSGLYAKEQDGQDILTQYSELLQQFNRQEELEIQAARVDYYLAQAKDYLSSQSDLSDSDEYRAVLYSVQKLKVFQYLFNTQHGQLRHFEASPEFRELLNFFLHGAINSSPSNLYPQEDYDFAALELSTISKQLKPQQLYYHKPLPTNPQRERERIDFLMALMSDAKLKNQLAEWTLDYFFEGKELFCRFVDQQVQQRCLVVSRILENDETFEKQSFNQVIEMISSIRQEAQRELDNQIEKDELFRPGRNVPLDKMGASPTPVNKRFAEHINILKRIDNIKMIQLLKADPALRKAITKLSEPMVYIKCDYGGYLGVPNCGYARKDNNSKYLNTTLLKKAYQRIRKQIANESVQLLQRVALLENLKSQVFTPKDQAASNLIVAREYNRFAQIVRSIDSLLIKEIETHPQSVGAALMEFPQFIPQLSVSMTSILTKINHNELKENLISVGLIAALVGSSFVTMPVGVGIGLVVTVYEIVHYNDKRIAYQQKLDAASVQLIEYQYKDLELTSEELKIMEQRFNELESKVSYYKMNTYFAAVGLIAAPISLGHIVSFSSNKLSSILSSMKFIEKLSVQLSQTSAMSRKFQYLLKISRVKHPSELLSAVMKLRRYLLEARTFSDAIFIQRIHHLIRTPERIHLSERSFAGANYIKNIVADESSEDMLLQMILDLEVQQENFFNQ